MAWPGDGIALPDPWAALSGNDVGSLDMKPNTTDKLNILQAYVVAPWTSYTPALVQTSAVTKTVTYAKWIQIGKTVMGSVVLVAGAAGVAGAQISSSLPVAPAYASSSAFAIGSFALVNGGTRQAGAVVTTGGSTVIFQSAGQTNVLGITPSYALASGDVLTFDFHYEVA